MQAVDLRKDGDRLVVHTVARGRGTPVVGVRITRIHFASTNATKRFKFKQVVLEKLRAPLDCNGGWLSVAFALSK
jgi:hypothetical protein